jgi:hypothetical protein
MYRTILLVCLFHLCLLVSPAGAEVADSANRSANASPCVSPASPSLDELASTLRSYIVRKVATQVYETNKGWGHTTSVPSGIKWQGKGVETHGTITKSERNDGIWRKIRATVPNIADNLTLELRNIQQPEPGRMLFDVLLSCAAQVEVEQQVWKKGLRLYSGTARARLRVKLALACELTTHLDWNAKLLPDGVFRLRVVHADLDYDHFALEHVAGLGGDAAKLIGDLLRGIIHRWHPSLERKWLAKTNAAIEKAADTKEIRIGVGSFMKMKAKPTASPDKTGQGKPG